MKQKPVVITDEVKILTIVCLLLKDAGAISERLLLEITTLDGLISPFGLNDALSIIENKKLAEVESVNEALNSSEKLFKITEAGANWAEDFKTSIPLEIREKLLSERAKLIRLEEIKKAARWDVYEEGESWVFRVKFLNETNSSAPIMEVKIYSTSKKQAEKIEKKFLKNPALIIRNTLFNFL